jgi:2-oxoglutarate dehydrogenase E1 component
MLCARDNIQVCNCTTPAQYFHLLRRQVKRSFLKPLVVMTPKSLLRHPRAISDMKELSNGVFQEVLDDPDKPMKPGRLILCTGKVYYDLLAAREEKKDTTAAILRIEQLYPFPERALKVLLDAYNRVSQVVWVQEEPRNRGAWLFMKDRFGRFFPSVPLLYVGREGSASPATGSHARHEREQRQVVAAALQGDAVEIQGK